MSKFDECVLEWLNSADLLEKSKQAVLDRAAAGIGTYKLLFAADPKMADVIDVNFDLLDVIDRAGRRLKEKQEPIVLFTPPSAPRPMLRPTASRASSRSATARNTSVPQQYSSPPPPIARPMTASEKAAMVSKAAPLRKRATTPTVTTRTASYKA